MLYCTIPESDLHRCDEEPKPESNPREDRPIRVDLVARVRRQIAEGTYVTEDKWELAVAKLLGS